MKKYDNQTPIGGSPCTYWSIAKTNGRETKAEGQGWELFKNYLIAKEKFKPDFFLYENNWSASKAIKDQIQEELGCELMRINSALVSAQKRDRFYVFNWDVEQPEDRGVLLKDILESGQGYNPYHDGKSRVLTASYYKAAENLNSEYGSEKPRHKVAELVGEDLTGQKKAYCLTAHYQGAIPSNTIERKQRTMIAEPVRIGTYPNAEGEIKNSQGNRIYDVAGKGVTLSANGGGRGAKTGLYAEAVKMPVKEGTKKRFVEIAPGDCVDLAYPNSKLRRGRSMSDKGHTLTCSNEMYQYRGTTDKPVYPVEDGQIEIKGKKYPIKLKDGKYIIRKLTPIECERLQTMPDNYTACVSNTQRYKGLGNGWTAEVIIHILNGVLKDVPKDEKIVVLSMYDGIGTGRYCLDKMGFTNVEYHAFEIDKFAKQVALDNYPDIIQHGDAFQIREWVI